MRRIIVQEQKPLDIKENAGDILSSGADIICHQTSCRGVMDTGLAKQIRAANPKMFLGYQLYCNMASAVVALGTALILPTDKSKHLPAQEQQFVANCFAQNGHDLNKRYTDYDALKQSLICVKRFALLNQKRNIAISYGMGCGLAGGDWSIVHKIICEVFHESGLCVTIWRYES